MRQQMYVFLDLVLLSVVYSFHAASNICSQVGGREVGSLIACGHWGNRVGNGITEGRGLRATS